MQPARCAVRTLLSDSTNSGKVRTSSLKTQFTDAVPPARRLSSLIAILCCPPRLHRRHKHCRWCNSNHFGIFRCSCHVRTCCTLLERSKPVPMALWAANHSDHTGMEYARGSPLSFLPACCRAPGRTVSHSSSNGSSRSRSWKTSQSATPACGTCAATRPAANPLPRGPRGRHSCTTRTVPRSPPARPAGGPRPLQLASRRCRANGRLQSGQVRWSPDCKVVNIQSATCCEVVYLYLCQTFDAYRQALSLHSPCIQPNHIFDSRL